MTADGNLAHAIAEWLPTARWSTVQPGRINRIKVPVAAPVARAPLSITSVPTSAEVWIDGHKVGETPLRDHALTAGAHTVWVRLEGVDSPRKSITVSAGAPLALRYDYQDKTWRTVK